jgi:hypothetical protein
MISIISFQAATPSETGQLSHVTWDDQAALEQLHERAR